MGVVALVVSDLFRMFGHGCRLVLFVNPYNFVPGGVYGMGIVLHNIFPSIQVGTFGYMFDVPLMLVAMLVFGGQFGTRTVLAALYTPGFMNVLTRLVYPDAAAVESLDPSLLLNGRLDLSNDLLLTCVIGAVVIGVGAGHRRAPAGDHGRHRHRGDAVAEIRGHQVLVGHLPGRRFRRAVPAWPSSASGWGRAKPLRTAGC